MQNKESEKKFPELLFCPFCGREAELRHNKDGFSYIVCANDGCYARTDGHLNDESAIKAWNTRKPMDKIVEQLEMTADAAHDEIMARQGSEQYYDGYGDGVNAAIEIIKEEINSKFEEKKI